jgi:hypothetical protein
MHYIDNKHKNTYILCRNGMKWTHIEKIMSICQSSWIIYVSSERIWVKTKSCVCADIYGV